MKVHGTRALLNKPGYSSTAAIVAEIEDTSAREVGKDAEGNEIKNAWQAEPEVTLQVANCDRSISFEFDWRTADGRENSLHKVDVLIDALTQFRAGLVVEQGRYIEYAKTLEDKG